MKKLGCLFLTLLTLSCAVPKNDDINHKGIEEDLNEILNRLSQSYTYLEEKNIDLNCIRNYYSEQIQHIKTEEETVLFFEYLLDEFYDNHLILRTNRQSSFRLFAPIYAIQKEGKIIIKNTWKTQVDGTIPKIIGAEILTFNGLDFEQAINNFPTHCNDKNTPETREWIINKILAGRYNETRILNLKLADDQVIEFDLDQIKQKNSDGLLSAKTIDQIGIIRINNSLGNDNLVSKFDSTLNELSNTQGLIIDLRNTIFGGDSYEARGIMSRFIAEPQPYQKHSFTAKSKSNPDIERSWIEYVTPRGKTYEKPVAILVGRWTGSMGEGLAIGFEGMKRATVVGSEMRRLAGEVYDFNFKNQPYGYKISTAKLFHVNGTIREKYIPTHYVNQTNSEKDEILEKGLELIHSLIKSN